MNRPAQKRPRYDRRLPLFISIAVHGLLAILLSLYIASRMVPEPHGSELPIEWIPIRDIRVRVRFPRKEIAPLPKAKPLRPTERTPPATASPTMIPEVVRRATERLARSTQTRPREIKPFLPEATTSTDLPLEARSSVSAPTSTPAGPDTGRGAETGRVRAAGLRPDRQGLSILDSSGVVQPGIAERKFTDTQALLPANKLGAVLVGRGRDLSGHVRIIRLKHSLADWWQDPTALPSLINWLSENTRIRADMKFAGGSLELTDPRILDAPLIIMTGHDKNVIVSHQLAKDGPIKEGFSEAESAALRRYLLDRRGILFFDDCGFKGIFAERVRQELKKVLPEYDLKPIPNSHEIYTIYYELSGPPEGGDVYWGSENRPQVSRFTNIKGIFVNGRLAVVYNRKDYLCAMETAEIPSRTMLRLRRSPDVYRFMTNLVVYAMKYGGNTDRSNYSNY